VWGLFDIYKVSETGFVSIVRCKGRKEPISRVYSKDLALYIPNILQKMGNNRHNIINILVLSSPHKFAKQILIILVQES
jgi:hypothetical protein